MADNFECWNDLPENVKLACIDRMDFRTRWKLRRTSRTEKRLVEETKTALCKDFRITRNTSDRQTLQFSKFNDDDVTIVEEETWDIFREVLKSFLKMGCFPYLKWSNHKPVSELIWEVAKEVPMMVEYFKFKYVSIHNLEFLHNCQGLEMVDVTLRKEDKTTFQELWNAWKPSLLYNFSVKNVFSMEVCEVVELIQKVIENNPKLDSLYKIKVLGHFSVQEVENAIMQKFGDAVSAWAGIELRIDIGCVSNVDKSIAVTYLPERISITCMRTVKGKNWCDLPAHLKLKCVEYMDLNTRWLLRYTARAEKELAESVKNGHFLLTIGDYYKNNDHNLLISIDTSFIYMPFNEYTFEVFRSINKTLFKMTSSCELLCSEDTWFKEVINDAPDYFIFTTPNVVLHSASITDIYNLKKFSDSESMDIYFCEKENITLGEILDAWQSSMPERIHMSNVYSIAVDDFCKELDRLAEKGIKSEECLDDAYVYIDVLTPFSGMDEVCERMSEKFGAAASIVDDNELRIELNIKNKIRVNFSSQTFRIDYI